MCKIKLPKIIGNLLDELRKLNRTLTVIMKFLAVFRQQKILGNTVNLILNPPSQISPPPLFRGRKVIISPSLLNPPSLPYLFYTNKLQTLLITNDCKTSCGLIRGGWFNNWKMEFDSDPRLHDLKLLVLELLRVVFQFLIEDLRYLLLRTDIFPENSRWAPANSIR